VGDGVHAHVLWDGYASGKWLDWEHLPGFMTPSLALLTAKRIVREVTQRCARRRSRHVMFMWGNDNRFVQAGNQFAAMDQVLSALNEMSRDTGFVARYSTPSLYFAATVSKITEISLQFIDAFGQDEERRAALTPPLAVVSGGFMPYAPLFPQRIFVTFWPRYCDGIGDNCWTGYYATRPAMKSALAQTRSLVRSSMTLASLTLSHVMQTVGVKRVQGHDFRAWLHAAAATGTSLEECSRQSLVLLHHDVAAGTVSDAVAGDVG
jgi:hypothetical protein